MNKIDLACGDNKKDGFFGIDKVEIPGVDLVHDLNVYPWPIEDESVDEINCSHFVEHIRHEDVLVEIQNILKESESFEDFKEKLSNFEEPADGFIRFMNEVYRILKPDGKITIRVPYVTHVRAFADPTHTRYLHEMSFYYFNKEWRKNNNLSHYDINTDFDISFSYFIDNSLTLKSEEVRNEMFKNNWNAIMDVIVDLKKL